MSDRGGGGGGGLRLRPPQGLAGAGPEVGDDDDVRVVVVVGMVR